MKLQLKSSLCFAIALLISPPLFAAEIHTAVQQGNLDAVKKEVEKDPKSVNLKDQNGHTPLHHAVMRYRPDIAREMLKHGADISLQDNN